MARINIEDSLFKDDRFIELCIKTGGQDRALGALVKVWIYAQKYFLTTKEIPHSVWKKQKLSEAIIECGLAEKTDTGVRACGQDEQFAWLSERSNSGKIGGKKSAALRKEKYGSAQPNSRSTAEAPRSIASKKPEATEAMLELASKLPKRPEASSSFSSSFLSSSSLSQNSNTKKYPSDTVPLSSDTIEKKGQASQKAVAIFCENYKRRYGVNYRILPKDARLLGDMSKQVGPGVYDRLCKAYVDMPDQWFMTRRHDVSTFVTNIAKVSQFEQSGKMVTQTEIKRVDKRQANANVFDAAIAKAEEEEKNEKR